MNSNPTPARVARGQPNASTWPRNRIESWADFQKTIERYLTGNSLFRGVTSVRHNLIPSVGRYRRSFNDISNLERELLDHFKREALSLLRSRPADNWEWLALAQHHGVPTRLLDRSESPYVSLFFAVWGNDHEDAGMYIVPRPTTAIRSLGNDPFAISPDEVPFYYPGHVTARLVSQRGLFTVHPNPTEVYHPPGMEQFVVSHEAKPEIRRRLDAIGIHHSTIYADLDGLARRLVAVQTYRAPDELPVPEEPPKSRINPQDPRKGRWGGSTKENGWSINGKVKRISSGWYAVEVEVSPIDNSKKLEGDVIFYLHDSFEEPVVTKSPRGGRAVLRTAAYGAFTLGAFVTQDGTRLELDLAELPDAPEPFRSR